MNPIPELITLLKQLRLSGILDSLEARNREAVDGQLAYTDFLGLLILDEVARRDQKKLDQRLRRANFRNQKTLEGFDFGHLPNLNRSAVHDLATCRFVGEKVAVLIAGRCGTGKSHIAPPGSATTCCSTPKANWLPACARHRPSATTGGVCNAWSTRRCSSSTTSG